MVPVISFVGRHNSGKTTFLSTVINELAKDGIKVAVVKHASTHLDIPLENDSEKLFNAGAALVYASSPDISIQYKREMEKSLEEIYTNISDDIDILITEGYKHEPHYKIEVMRKEISDISMDLENTLALVTDFSVATKIPVFNFDQGFDMAKFIKEKLNIDSSNI